MLTVRPACADDADVLLQALALAADWRSGAPVRAAAQVLADPELPVGIVAEQRGRGAGTALLRVLLQAAVEEGLPGLSLSVEPDNPAVHLYRRLGFERVGRNGGAETMLLRLR